MESGGSTDDRKARAGSTSGAAYQELLWHALLRGTDTFFLWCTQAEDAEECRLVHEVYSAAQEYGEFLQEGTAVWFDVPKQPGAVVSGIRLGNRLLVRRTDFGGLAGPAEMPLGAAKVSIKPSPGKCQVVSLSRSKFADFRPKAIY